VSPRGRDSRRETPRSSDRRDAISERPPFIARRSASQITRVIAPEPGADRDAEHATVVGSAWIEEATEVSASWL
jgi:hypothetical protein